VIRCRVEIVRTVGSLVDGLDLIERTVSIWLVLTVRLGSDGGYSF
jgi:hypothetical protein